jgi:hypothetical protein
MLADQNLFMLHGLVRMSGWLGTNVNMMNIREE